MKEKTQVKKTYHFSNRSQAVAKVGDAVSDPAVTSLTFSERTWYKPDSEERFEVEYTYTE